MDHRTAPTRPFRAVPRRRLGSTLGLALGAAVVVMALVVGIGIFAWSRLHPSSGSPQPAATGTGAPPAGGATWWSGASSDQAADGSFGKWRGSDVTIGGTWDNGNDEQVAMRSICEGKWTTWDKPLDIAIGAIDVDADESWAAAADGAYVDRWRQSLTKMKECWGARDPSLLYIRFAHEMNLRQKWRVHGGHEAEFVKAITLYSNLRYEILPKAKIVLCPNDGTNATLDDLDVRKLWPGKDDQGRPVADIYAIDSYNSSPHANSDKEFAKKINATYPNGAPLGIEKHRQFAEQMGVPFAVSEWSNDGDTGSEGGGGESPNYVQQFHAWAKSHAGNPAKPAPGQLLYEIQFNLFKQYAFWPETIQPETADAYKKISWGH